MTDPGNSCQLISAEKERMEIKMGFFNGTDDANEKAGKPQHIKGIACDVKNCVYHDGDHYCTADKIAVGPSYATSCTDTVCATFKQKNI